jgi:transposase-like protein
MTTKRKIMLISTEKVNHLCKCWTKPRPPSLKRHTKEVFSDGWTRWVCSNCGKVKFTWGEEATGE